MRHFQGQVAIVQVYYIIHCSIMSFQYLIVCSHKKKRYCECCHFFQTWIQAWSKFFTSIHKKKHQLSSRTKKPRQVQSGHSQKLTIAPWIEGVFDPFSWGFLGGFFRRLGCSISKLQVDVVFLPHHLTQPQSVYCQEHLTMICCCLCQVKSEDMASLHVAELQDFRPPSSSEV